MRSGTIVLFILSCIFYSCSSDINKSSQADPTLNHPDTEKERVIKSDSILQTVSNPDSNGHDLSYTVFKNAELDGYGYDVEMGGKPYIHQPNIPAVSGNKGFQTQEEAKRVAEFVLLKIKKNILPPTIDVKELDSMHVIH